MPVLILASWILINGQTFGCLVNYLSNDTKIVEISLGTTNWQTKTNNAFHVTSLKMENSLLPWITVDSIEIC